MPSFFRSSVLRHLGAWAIAALAIAGIASCSGGSDGGSADKLTNQAPPVPTSGWSIIDLGTLSGSGSSAATNINDNGSVVGFSDLDDTNEAFHAFLYQNGQMIDLGTLGGQFSAATSINNAGQIVGWSDVNEDGSISIPFLYQNGTMTALAVEGVDFGDANDINAFGRIVGLFNAVGSEVPIAFIYSDGTISNLADANGQAIAGNPVSINDRGQIALNILGSAFLYDTGGTLTDLGSLASGPRTELGTEAFGINGKGEIVGQSNGVAFLYSNGQMTSLGTLPGVTTLGLQPGEGASVAAAINENSQIVGSVFLRENDALPVAFLYSGGTIVDLNSLSEVKAAGWNLSFAFGINRSGQIVGTGINREGQVRAFLLTPPALPQS